ncbi:prephenate dehydratase (plasmid) [Paracoccus versutus]|uniref:prephenate dehydratase n=1 Tax=Paracoccus versutus TaxID=34007 RepID=A0A099FQV0_PARVE|nr:MULTISPECIES: prephenate dehydratase [Paracoccus]WGR63063.1 prephenate dehydratase [Paracoccus ferrooxidans]SFX03772.1 prephenate dehydratase [Paracoccus pantotrophus]KGJ12528.1 prephenate dehydratase [Paracoccus versutus]MBT0780895.1 prephenate dehydratase [Paracoccus sp. pheM1]MCJ1899539.1 prephenate dehydratase [Paracoccus versutus]
MTDAPTQNVIAFQGEPGAYSHQACRFYRPQMEALPCRTFEDTIEAVRGGKAELAMLPVENSTYGRVADIHHLLPETGLHIIDEGFVRVRISLLAVPGTKLSQVSDAMSHPVLLGQCRGFLRRHAIRGMVGADTAGSALEVARRGEPSLAALAAPLAGEIYGLEELASGIEDRQNNTTRFLVMARQPDFSRRTNAQGGTTMMTSFVFRVRNIPAALYKALGGFATNGVNMTKLESYMVDGVFTATQFYADIEGHPEDPHVARALEELDYFTSSLNILGVYPADPLRAAQSQAAAAAR